MLKKLKTKFFLWLMSQAFYKWALRHFIPYIRFTTYYTSMRGYKYHIMYEKLRPGHIIVTIDRRKLTTLLIPGNFSHATLCVSKDKNFEMAEMTHKDFTKSTFSDVCYEADRILILECLDFDSAYIEKVVAKCKSMATAKYDTDFELGIEALYCSELIYHSDFEHRLDISLEDLVGMGRPYLSPDGLTRAKNVRIVADSDTL